ncbi:MAG: hypothetical protein OEZ06_13345 [Myxococcales bacterium]|nr:hypothetical protein [Myxococcales bacterium]
MAKYLCSILVTLLLALCAAAPVLAQDDEESSEGGEGDAPADGDYEQDDGSWERPPPDEEKPKPAAKQEAPVAEGAGDGLPWDAALLLGYSFKTDRISTESVHPYGLGAALRGGYSWNFDLYTGLYYFYYLGTSHDDGEAAGIPPVIRKTSANYMLMGSEFGYNLWASDSIIIRPTLMLGAAVGMVSKQSPGEPEVRTVPVYFTLGPGLTLLFTSGAWEFGGDLRSTIIPGDGDSTFGVFGTVGYRFDGYRFD